MNWESAGARAMVAAVLLALLWLLESSVPMFTGRQHRAANYVRNLSLGLFNAVAVSGIAAGALLYLTEVARESRFGLLYWLDVPLAVRWVVAFFLLDLWQYAWHRMNHTFPLLWRFHAVHHSDAQLDASSAVRFHTGEILFSSLARMAVLPLLGIRMEELAVYEFVLLPVTLFHHANVRLPTSIDKLLRLIMVTPGMHWVHHSRMQAETDSNYSSVLSIWDRLFGSFRWRTNPGEITLGLDDFEVREWQRAKGMWLIPFMHDFNVGRERRRSAEKE